MTSPAERPMSLDVVNILSDLVRIPSVNPMGRPVSGDIYYEHRMTAHLEALFRGLGLPTERHTVAPLRDNIVTRVDGDVPPERGGPIVMLEAHQDTVPIDGMTIDPFMPTVKDGRLYGRGSCDIKGGMGAMIAALARLAKEKPAGRPTVVLACTINEEHGFTGATHWAATYSGSPPDSGHGPEIAPPAGRSRLLPRVPDAAIVAEPTLLNVVVAHKGAVRWKCSTKGVATHSSQPHLGENAIYRMAPVLQALDRYGRDVAPKLASHPLCGQPTLSVGLISGGLSVNTIPDRCTIEIDRRVVPGESAQGALDHCLDFLKREVPAEAKVVHERPFMMTSGLRDEGNGRLAERLGDAVRRHGGPGKRIGVPFGTDAPHFAATGCPTVVFGPGSVDQAHTADEWLDLDQLKAAVEILYDFVRQA
jgi:acetylornithine deacetylase/succinyl-diaminopimelate desuccinylase-like protein